LANKTTRSAKGGGTLRKRSDGRWEARYSLGFDPKTGKQIQRSVYGKTQKEVRQKLASITTEIDNGTYTEPSRMKVSDWLKEWLRDYIGNVKQSTVKSYTDHVNLNIIPYIGNVELSKLTTPMIQRMYNELLREKELSPKTVKNVHGVLHRALEQAQKMGFIRTNPTEAVTLPRIEKKQIKPLEDEELTAFLQAIKGHPYELVFFVTVFTGLREGEVLGLTWDCVDFEQSTLLINKQHGKVKGSKEYRFSSLKNDKPRVLRVADGVMDALRKQKTRQEIWQNVFRDQWENPDNLVFTTKTGRYLCNQTVYASFKNVARALGFPSVRFHDLRHTFAVNSLKSGDDIKTVQENLGHHTAAFTLDTYAHVTSGMKKESASRMDQYIHSVTGA
jgi:integrase